MAYTYPVYSTTISSASADTLEFIGSYETADDDTKDPIYRAVITPADATDNTLFAFTDTEQAYEFANCIIDTIAKIDPDKLKELVAASAKEATLKPYWCQSDPLTKRDESCHVW